MGRRIDNSDSQYSGFRSNLTFLVPAMIIYLILSHVLGRISTNARSVFSITVSICAMLYMYGISTVKVFLVMSLNYMVTKTFPRSIFTRIFVWIFGLVVLYIGHEHSGLKFDSIHSNLSFLDAYDKTVMRWWVTFNFSVLRMISFTMDNYWCLLEQDVEHGETVALHRRKKDGVVDPARIRVEKSHAPEEYNFLNYLTYMTYLPLFLAGPIVTFNEFLHQFKCPPDSIKVKGTVVYALRWIGAVLLMEWMMHYVYVVAIGKAKAWSTFTPLEMAVFGYFSLKFIWLKLLIIWRFFRLWAMADGVETVENMHRCMSNNYSASGFWRSWHRSFNRWLIRYMYIPLGGTKYFMYNIWITFTFVAVWHDISFTLLAWSWLICLFLLPEFIGQQIFSEKKASLYSPLILSHQFVYSLSVFSNWSVG